MDTIMVTGCSTSGCVRATIASGADLSGFVPADPSTGQLVEGDIEVQTDRVLQNLQAVLEAAESSLEKAVKTTVFLADRKDFAGMNKMFGRYFPKDPPARSTLEARLVIDAKVEIELIALA